MPTFKLISLATCPYVQRSVITLEEKGAPYETIHVDLENKPDWFLEVSPLGKVPVLLVRDGDREVALFESAVINEYLDEVTEGSLLPADPLARAQQRAMIELGSAAMADAWRLAVAATEDEARTHTAALRDKLRRFEAQIVGPLYAGESLCLVDAAVLPVLQRAAWANDLAPSLGIFEGLPKLARWLEAGSARESVRRSTVGDVADRYRQIFVERGSWVGKQAA